MYPVIRLEKLHPDGSRRRVGRGYRLADVDGVARVFVPAGTRFWHANGEWRTTSAWISAFHPGWRFVPHRSFPPGEDGLYVDIARRVLVDDDRAAFIDLYLDVMAIASRVWEKDAELLGRLAEAEAASARETAARVRGQIARGEGLFRLDHPVWTRPSDAARLPPLAAEELG